MSPSKSLAMEGRLSKFTNVIKGYQYRHFVVDPYTATLNYYISEDLKAQKPKGSIQLKDSVILASDDDPTMFTIHRFDNKLHTVYYLKAQDTKERNKWIQILKMNSISDLDGATAFNNKTSQEDPTNTVNTCFICLDSVTESTATMCGHLFCRNCIHKWIQTKPVCPVCNSKISKDKLIRLYGINDNSSANTSDNTFDKVYQSNTNDSSYSDREPLNSIPRINHNRQRTFNENMIQMFNQIIHGIFVYIGLVALVVCLFLAIVFYFSAILGTFCFVFSVWCISLIMKR